MKHAMHVNEATLSTVTVRDARLKPGDQAMVPQGQRRPLTGVVEDFHGTLLLRTDNEAESVELGDDDEVVVLGRIDREDEKADRERARLKADTDAFVAWVYARTLWTSGSETRATIAAKDARYSVQENAPVFVEWRRFIQLNMSLNGMLDRLSGAPR